MSRPYQFGGSHLNSVTMNAKQLADRADAYALHKYFSSHSYEETKSTIDRLMAEAPADRQPSQYSKNEISNMVFHVFNIASLIHHLDKCPIVSMHYPVASCLLENTNITDLERALCDGLINWLVGSDDTIPVSTIHMIPFFEIKTVVMQLEREGCAQCA